MSISTRIRRHGAGLFTIGAVAALAAGCGAGPTPADGSAGDGAGDGAARSDVQVATGADRSPAAAGGDAAPSDGALPENWSGTVSTERFGPGDDSGYLAMQTLHGERAQSAMSAEQIEGTEFLAGSDARCEGEAELDGAASACTFAAVDGSGTTMDAQVRLVSTGFGNTALLFGVSGEGEPALPVAPGADHALQTIKGEDIAQVTDEDLEADVTSAVMMGHSHDGELPADVTVDCGVVDGGEHGQCEVAGTPDGGGDGTWYATAQSGYDGDRAAYLFTRLPSS